MESELLEQRGLTFCEHVLIDKNIFESTYTTGALIVKVRFITHSYNRASIHLDILHLLNIISYKLI